MGVVGKKVVIKVHGKPIKPSTIMIPVRQEAAALSLSGPAKNEMIMEING